MVALVMYSDQIIPENAKIDERLLDLLAERGRRIGYVSSGPEPDRRFYNERQAYYAKLDIDLRVFFDTSASVEEGQLATLFDCDAIHLSGGNTRVFLHLLKINKLLERLAEWAQKGGLLIGTSAGAILMTPTVALDAIFSDDDPWAIRNSKALGIVPFEFFPHLNENSDHLPKLFAYSSQTSRSIAACRDGDGVVVNGDAIESIGDVVWIRNGEQVDPMTMVR
ncbi:MAG: Type 1 glutamine amidotransferase-like domain-containing protein [Paracoccaceae bacterium]